MIEAMKQALEALERCGSENYSLEREAITALRQALSEAQLSVNENSHAIEQAEKQEPVIGTKTWYEDGKVITQNLYPSDVYKQEKQEPVCDTDPRGCWSVRCQLGNKCKNTPAPQREWVGLTDEDRLHLVDTHVGFVSPFHPLSNDDWINYASAIEAKLKEKNA